jgi:hypothetical protein
MPLTFRVDADIKTASLAQIAATPVLESETEQVHEVPPVEAIEHPVQSDPTIVNAGKHNLAFIFHVWNSRLQFTIHSFKRKFHCTNSEILQVLLRSMSLLQPS